VDRDPEWVERVRCRLRAWYEEARRHLPWREERDPYLILVSEMMLVQTTVAAVVPYYERFVERFPTVQALARADEADVIKAWEGLGYYRRARQLHAAARRIVENHSGAVPNDLESVLELPGVGRYIAGAVLSFAFNKPVPIVEANTQRVLARWLAWPDDLKSSHTQTRLWEAAGRLVPPTDAGSFNQAFMELGALVCTPRTPLCLVCPVATECRARALGMQDQLPVQTPKPRPLAVTEACALVSRKDRVLVLQRGTGGLWEGFWEFPTIHVAGADPAGRSLSEFGPMDLAQGIQRLSGVVAEVGPAVHSVDFTVTRHRVHLDAHEALGLSDALTPGPGIRAAAWERPETLRDYPFAAAGRKLIGWLLRRG
jgi:A/G-specific adenine glycosylase